MIGGDEPAYPAANAHRVMQDGLTKRELFAAMAMQALVSNGYACDPRGASVMAVKHADAIIEELDL